MTQMQGKGGSAGKVVRAQPGSVLDLFDQPGGINGDGFWKQIVSLLGILSNIVHMFTVRGERLWLDLTT